MTDLLDTVLAAHGGRARRQQAHQISARQRFGGVLWALKGHPGALDDVDVTVDLHREFTSQQPFFAPNRRTAFTPERIAVEDTRDGSVVEELLEPRDSFAGHELTTPWTRLQLAYFSGYAMWTYLSEPISLTFPGVLTEEIEPWTEDGQKFRRLRVTYPATIATHSSNQVLYVDNDGLLRRRDYSVDIAGGAPSAHYISGHYDVAGLIIPPVGSFTAATSTTTRSTNP
jgi:hypothetical protein